MARPTRASTALYKRPSDSTTAMSRRSLRNRTGAREIKNSSDISDDELTVDAKGKCDEVRSDEWPKVIVPTYYPHKGDSTAMSAASAEASIFNDSSVEDPETPLTSAAATPFGKTAARSSKRLSAASNLSSVNKRLATTTAPASVQYKQRTRRNQADSDEQLARELQEQEYAGKPLLKHARHNQKPNVLDSDDSVGSSDEISLSPLPQNRKRKPVVRLPPTFKRLKEESTQVILPSRLPSRGARVKAQASLNSKSFNDAIDIGELDPDNIDDDEDGDESFSEASELSELSQLSEISDSDSNAGVKDKGIKAKFSSKLKKKGGTKKLGDRTNTKIVIFKAAGESRSEYERRRLETAHPKLKTLWEDLADIPVITPHKTPQPEGISRTLKSFQLEGVDWMRRMELESQWKGGLLGDEMGMGKTIQAVSLIMSDYPAGKPTLVVVPPVALLQWSAEIKAYTNGKLRVLVHHNTDSKVKHLKVKDLIQYDVIMISYSGLESMHRKEVKGWKRDDGLVKENSRIHAIQYHRLILDEAHSIKSRTTQVAKACFALKSDHKWCLSGTPVQNRIGEFFSLLRFLEVEPFASYFCKDCACESLHWSQTEDGKCKSCGHTGFNHVSLFNQELLNPITSGSLDDRALAMSKLRLLTDRIMLRRMKRDHTSSMELPPKKIELHNEFFGPEEHDFSRSIMTNTTRTFDTYVARGVELNNYANIFGLIMQMRQVANHPDLILKKNGEGGQNILVCSICDEPAEEPIRSQCHHEFCRRCAKDYVRSFAKNGADPDCPKCHINLRIDFDQPDIEQDEDVVKKSSIINRIKMEDWHSSSKIEMLIYELFRIRAMKRTRKSIVFSQFTSMLQLVEWRLRRAGFSTVMLDGSMGPGQRQKSIEYFMTNVNVEVFLVSLKAGGVALNLTQASEVFIVDPWWNPAAEWQSADRCHRIGQKRGCKITRLCIEDSVESRMVMLQEKKANLINGTVNGDDVALGKLTPEDLQFLFRGS